MEVQIVRLRWPATWGFMGVALLLWALGLPLPIESFSLILAIIAGISATSTA